jgi:ferredoxin
VEELQTTMIVRILRQECCGSALCTEIAPDVFALDSKNKAIVLDAEAVPREKLLEAAEACPCSAIVLEDDMGNRQFP